MSDPARRRADLAQLGSQVQVAVAVLSVAVALLALAAGLGATGLDHYAVFGGVVLVGGLALLAAAYRPLRLTWWQWLLVAVAGVAGTAASLLVRTESGCCLFSFHVRSGYPFDFTGWSMGFDDVVSVTQAYAAARDRPSEVSRSFEAVPMAADALFWAYAALLVVVPTRQVIRAFRRPAMAGDAADSHDTADDQASGPDVEAGSGDRPGGPGLS
jgi:hypothetical protein